MYPAQIPLGSSARSPIFSGTVVLDPSADLRTIQSRWQQNVAGIICGGLNSVCVPPAAVGPAAAAQALEAPLLDCTPTRGSIVSVLWEHRTMVDTSFDAGSTQHRKVLLPIHRATLLGRR